MRSSARAPWSMATCRNLQLLQAYLPGFFVCGTASLNEFVDEYSGVEMNQLAGRRFLITGGAGFVGSTICDQLLAAGAAEIRIIDNFVRGCWANIKPAVATGRVKVTEGDIRDAELVDSLTE